METSSTTVWELDLSLQKIVDQLCSTLEDTINISFFSFSLVDHNTNELRNIRATGITRKQQSGTWKLEALPDTIRISVIRNRETVSAVGTIDPLSVMWYDCGADVELTRIFIPVDVSGTVLAIVETGFLNTEHPSPPSEENRRILEKIIHQAGTELEHLHLIKQLKQERHLLHTLMDTIPDSIYFKDTRSRFIRISKALARKFGVSDPTDLVGKTDFDLFTQEHAQQAFDDEQQILRTGTPEIDIVEKETWNDNRITWVSTTKMPLRDDDRRIIGTFGISRDITSRKEMEDELKMRLEFEKNITSLSSKFINLDVHFINDAVHDALSLIGEFTSTDRCFVTLLDEQGSSTEKWYEWHADDVPPVTNRYAYFASCRWFNEMILNGRDITVGSIETLPDAAGSERTFLKENGVRSFVYLPLIVAGLPGGFIGIETVHNERKWSDNTTALLKIIGEVIMNAFSRKRAEKKLKHANNILEQRVTERTEDLKNTNDLLRTHIGQLNFLNSSVYRLSPIISPETLQPVVLDIFMTRFPNAQGVLCQKTGEAFTCASATPGVNDPHNCSCFLEAASRMYHPDLNTPLLIDNRTSDERLSDIRWTGVEQLRVYIVIPLITDNTCKALLQILATLKNAASFYLENSLLTTLAAHAAICLSNALNYEARAEKARLDGELDAARSIQHRLTPQHHPDIPHINLKGVYFPAYKVGGDYLDYFQTQRGDWVVVIADVCGKGIPAALLMTTMRSAFRILAETEASARDLLCAINNFMVHHIDERSFVTALALVITTDGTQMSYARAGHPLLIKLDNQGGTPQNIACAGIALGLMQEVDQFGDFMEEKILPLKTGDRFLIYTDGLIEAENNDSAPYGYGRLNTILTHDTASNPEQLIDKIVTDVRNFTDGAPDHDDLTLLALQVV